MFTDVLLCPAGVAVHDYDVRASVLG